MNESMNQAFEVDLKDLLCYILKHTTTLVTVAIVFALIGTGYSFVKQTKSSDAPVTNVMDTSIMLPGESEEAYNNRIANIERANDIMENIFVLTQQVQIQSDYISDSVYMQIDPLNVASTKIQVVITCDSNTTGELESLYQAYNYDITSGDYIDSVADELGCSSGAIQELISCELTTSDMFYSDGTNQMGVMTVIVLGKTVDETDSVMNAIIAEIESDKAEFTSSIAPHSLSLIGRQSSVGYDSDVRKNQLDSVSTLNTLQTQINNLNVNLDNTAKALGLTDRNSFYSDIPNQTSNGVSSGLTVKYSAIGFILGFFLAAGFYISKYILGRKIISQTQFFCLFHDCRKIGVLSPISKRNALTKIMDKISGDDPRIAADKAVELTSANFKNLTKDMNRVLLTGTVDESIAKEAVKDMDITCDIKTDFFNSPEILRTVSDYDGVVILEQRGVSEKKAVKREIELLKNGVRTIIGAIII